MRPPSNSRSLRSALILNILPLLFLSITLVTTWSGIGAWIGADIGGQGWTSFVAKFSPEILDQIRDSTELRSRMREGENVSEIIAALQNYEIVFKSDPKTETRKWRPLVSTGTLFSADEIKSFPRPCDPGFHLIENKLYYCSAKFRQQGSSVRNLVLARKISSLSERLARLTDPELVSTLRSTPMERSYIGKTSLTVSNYRGYKVLNSPTPLYQGTALDSDPGTRHISRRMRLGV